MAKAKNEFLIPVSKAVQEVKKNIENRKNDTAKLNSNIVYTSIETTEEDKLMTWIEQVGVKAYNDIDKLTVKVNDIRKPDIPGGNVHNGGMDFTKAKDEFSDARVKELQIGHKLLNDLIDAFDKAMEVGSETNWKAVEVLSNKVK